MSLLVAFVALSFVSFINTELAVPR